MSDPTDRGVRARATITPLTDAAIEVHDLDSSFDLGAFAAETSDSILPASATEEAGGPATAQPTPLNAPTPITFVAAESARPHAGAPVPAPLVAAAAAVLRPEALRADIDELARLEALARTGDLPTRAPAAMPRSGASAYDRPPATRPLARSWPVLAAAAILLATLGIAIVGLRGGAQVERAAQTRLQQQAPEQAADAHATVPAPEASPTPAKAPAGATTLPARTAAATSELLLPKPRGPRARGAVQAAAVILAASPGVPAAPMAAARERVVRPTAPSVERAVSTRGVIPARTSAPVPAVDAPPPVPSGAPAGWLLVEAPVELDLSIDGTRLGTTRRAPALVSAGAHVVVLSDARSGFHRTSRVRVEPGETSTLVVAVPDGALSVEAQPEAQVFVDGEPLGTTPLERVPVAAGVRKVVVRNGSLGERTYEVVVREGQHTALSVDLRPR